MMRLRLDSLRAAVFVVALGLVLCSPAQTFAQLVIAISEKTVTFDSGESGDAYTPGTRALVCASDTADSECPVEVVIFQSSDERISAEIVDGEANEIRIGFIVRPQNSPSASSEAHHESSDTVEIAFWNSVRDSAEASEFRAYLEQYPRGQFSQLARLRIRRLEGGTPGAAREGRIVSPEEFPSGVTVKESGLAVIKLVRTAAVTYQTRGRSSACYGWKGLHDAETQQLCFVPHTGEAAELDLEKRFVALDEILRCVTEMDTGIKETPEGFIAPKRSPLEFMEKIELSPTLMAKAAQRGLAKSGLVTVYLIEHRTWPSYAFWIATPHSEIPIIQCQFRNTHAPPVDIVFELKTN